MVKILFSSQELFRWDTKVKTLKFLHLKIKAEITNPINHTVKVWPVNVSPKSNYNVPSTEHKKNTVSLYICIKSMHFPHAPLPKGQKYLQVFQVNKKNHGDIK